MKDEEIIDELIDVVQKIADHTPYSPNPNPNLAIIQAKLVQIKAQRLISKTKFIQAFLNFPKIIKQIIDIK
jgi:hypothetical protein